MSFIRSDPPTDPPTPWGHQACGNLDSTPPLVLPPWTCLDYPREGGASTPSPPGAHVLAHVLAGLILAGLGFSKNIWAEYGQNTYSQRNWPEMALNEKVIFSEKVESDW